eukprot:1192127-Prymnesium_polylepis.1
MAAQDLWDDENVIAPLAPNVKKGSDAARGSSMRVRAHRPDVERRRRSRTPHSPRAPDRRARLRGVASRARPLAESASNSACATACDAPRAAERSSCCQNLAAGAGESG